MITNLLLKIYLINFTPNEKQDKLDFKVVQKKNRMFFTFKNQNFLNEQIYCTYIGHLRIVKLYIRKVKLI